MGCSIGRTKVEYARSQKLPEELNGFMRLAQDKVKVQVIGHEDIGEFDASEKTSKPEYKHLSAYIVLHELDVKGFVRNVMIVEELMKDPIIAEKIKLIKEGK